MNSRDEKLSLSLVLKNSIIPWAEKGGMTKVFTARPLWESAMEVPEGVRVTRQTLRSKRVSVRGGRHYGGSAIADAVWPEDKLQSTRTPKLCFVLEGPVAMRIADYTVHCRPSHGILIPSGVPFASGSTPLIDNTASHRGVITMLMLIAYHGGLLCWLSRQRCNSEGQWKVKEESSSIPYSRVPFYLNQLADEATGNHMHRQIVTESLLKIVVAQLHRELQELPAIQTGEINFVDGEVATGQKEYSIAQARDYIHHNLREPLSIDKVARFVCMSRTVFTEQFRALTGKSFAAYVSDMRFEEAAKLLKVSDLSLRDICQLIGLKPCRLRSLFHEREGISPTEFRRRSRVVSEISG